MIFGNNVEARPINSEANGCEVRFVGVTETEPHRTPAKVIDSNEKLCKCRIGNAEKETKIAFVSSIWCGSAGGGDEREKSFIETQSTTTK